MENQSFIDETAVKLASEDLRGIIDQGVNGEKKNIRSKLKRLAAASVLVFSGVQLYFNTSEVSSETANNYPWKSALDQEPLSYTWWFDENGNGSREVTNGNYSDDDETVDPNGYFYRNCTSYAAWKMQSLGYTGNLRGLGSAKSWDNNALSRGLKVDNSPRIGDVAVWEFGDYGHVAVVEKVNTDGSVYISEYNGDRKGNYNPSRLTRADHYIHFLSNPPASGGSTPNPSPNTGSGLVSYDAIADGQEMYNEQGWVYTKVGGTAWPIKHRNNWNSGDTFNWGGTPIGPVPNKQVWDHEAGVDINGNRAVGAHPPRDGTAVFVEGDLTQYVFVRGGAYPVTTGELDVFSIRNKALRLPQLGNRLMDYAGVTPKLENGELYRYATNPRVNQLIREPDGSTKSYYVNNETVLDCLEYATGKPVLVLPNSAQTLMYFNYGAESNEISACSYPQRTVVLGPGGTEQWKIEGDNKRLPYKRRYVPDERTAWLSSGGEPSYHWTRSVPALNNIVQGPNQTIPEGTVFRNESNGDVFLWSRNDAHKVLYPDTLKCLGSPAVLSVIDRIISGIHQGEPVSCKFENKELIEPNGTVWYVKGSQRHYVQNTAIAKGIEGRAGSGAPIAVSHEAPLDYPQGANAFTPYGVPLFARYPGDPTIWKVNPDGTRQHAGSLCVPDYLTTQFNFWRAWEVPTGEMDGHVVGPDWFATPQACADIKNAWGA